MKTITLQLTVRYDAAAADADTIMTAANILMGHALSTPGILADLNNPQFSDFELVEFHE